LKTCIPWFLASEALPFAIALIKNSGLPLLSGL